MEILYRLDDINDVAAELLMAFGERNVIAFSGEMGSGKTTLIHAICRRVGVKVNMGSPTFSIINEYESNRGPVFHIDLYRCRDEEEAIRAGVEDCIYSGCLCMVEWPERAPSLFPEETIRVSLTENVDGIRKISIT